MKHEREMTLSDWRRLKELLRRAAVHVVCSNLKWQVIQAAEALTEEELKSIPPTDQPDADSPTPSPA